MSKYQITNLKSATIEIKKVGDRYEIFASKKACEKMDYPYTDGQIFDENGDNYKNLSDFQSDYDVEFIVISGDDIMSQEQSESSTVEILSEIAPEGQFSSIVELKRISAAFELKEKRKPKIHVEIVITTGKFRPNGKAKKWIEGNLKVSSFVSEIKNKWLFLDGQIYAKEFTNGKYKLS